MAKWYFTAKKKSHYTYCFDTVVFFKVTVIYSALLCVFLVYEIHFDQIFQGFYFTVKQP